MHQRDQDLSIDVLGWLASGMTNNEILADYREVTADDIRACLAFAADSEQHFRIASIR